MAPPPPTTPGGAYDTGQDPPPRLFNGDFFINSVDNLTGSTTSNTGLVVSYAPYDALNRPIQLVAPHSDQLGARVNVTQPTYNEANLREPVDVWLNQNG